MKFTSINSSLCVTNKDVLKEISESPGYKGDLDINVYVEEDDDSRHITFNVDHSIQEGVDLWIDLDIYQAELFGKKILQLVEDRKAFLNTKFTEK